MILYSADKKFMGMDHDDLQQLGYKTLPEFIKDYQDFADTFIDRPGYIYNYEDFSWIDYILNSNDSDFKAMVYSNSNGFACDLEISPYYLVSSPQSHGYAVNLHHIRALSKEEISYINKIATSGKGGVAQVNMLDDNTIDILKNTPTPNVTPEPIYNSFQNNMQQTTQNNSYQENQNGFSHDNSAIISKLSISPHYRFDPIVAAEELGLAVEVIEEFIDDFVEQAQSVKDELLAATHKKEFKDVEGISHKLKGVAANLRIEDSLEVLTKINSSHNQHELEVLIDHFYDLIVRLGESKISALNTQDDVPEEILLNLDLDEGEGEKNIKEDVVLDESSLAQPNINQEEKEFIEEDHLLLSIDEDVPQENLPNETVHQMEGDSLNLETFDEIPQTTPNKEPSQYIEDDALSLDSFEEIPQNEDTLSIISESDSLEIELPDLNFNPLQASQEMGIDMELFGELLEDFKIDSLEHLTNIKNAINANDFTDLQKNAEIFKDISDNLHIQEISTTLTTLKESQDLVELQKLHKILEHYISQL